MEIKISGLYSIICPFDIELKYIKYFLIAVLFRKFKIFMKKINFLQDIASIHKIFRQFKKLFNTSSYSLI